MINDFLGWLSLILILLVIIKLFKKDQTILKLLLFAFFLRASLVIINNYFFPLPGSTFDARTFELIASNISEQYGLAVLFEMFQNDVYLMSRIISIFYTLTSRSEMMAQGISIGIGTTSVYLVYYLSSMLWKKKDAIKAAWLYSFFPSILLYSAITLREVYINFFLLLTLIACVALIKQLFKNKNEIKITFSLSEFKLLIVITIGFLILKYFHGPIFLGYLSFLSFIVFYYIRKEFVNVKKGIIKLNLLFMFSLVVAPVLLFYFSILSIPYIPAFEELVKMDDILLRRFRLGTVSAVHGELGASFPKWTIPSDMTDFFPKVFIRIFYFLYSPFPWDIKRTVHIFGFFDVIFILYLTYGIWNNRIQIWQNPETRVLLLILLTFIFIYGVGSSNFGTSIRHKSKFIFIAICLIAPKLHRFLR
ncbi:MAG: hypothetical protein CBB97_04015 [Candidatus Endolissoclinum sp. TMED37]|nr:MAG: hypothetical protein CBB97_04015 [Candidatus Endolissoclinum sp. TMED37]